jgi:tetratricopeptide (TPR) repeat protein
MITGRVLALTAALVLVASPGRGDPDPLAAKRRARQHFVQGDAYLQAGNYQGALDEFLECYRLFPNERLQFNIGQVYRLMGNKEKAVEHYRKFLEAGPDLKEAEEARYYLEALSPPEQASEATAPKVELLPEGGSPPSARPPARRAQPEAKPSRDATFAFVSGMSTFAFLVVAGGLTANGTNIERRESDTSVESERRRLRSDAVTSYSVAGAFFGLTAVGIAMTLYFIHRVFDDRPARSLGLGLNALPEVRF